MTQRYEVFETRGDGDAILIWNGDDKDAQLLAVQARQNKAWGDGYLLKAPVGEYTRHFIRAGHVDRIIEWN